MVYSDKLYVGKIKSKKITNKIKSFKNEIKSLYKLKT